MKKQFSFMLLKKAKSTGFDRFACKDVLDSRGNPWSVYVPQNISRYGGKLTPVINLLIETPHTEEED